MLVVVLSLDSFMFASLSLFLLFPLFQKIIVLVLNT
jgi:hypothetical protein